MVLVSLSLSLCLPPLPVIKVKDNTSAVSVCCAIKILFPAKEVECVIIDGHLSPDREERQA